VGSLRIHISMNGITGTSMGFFIRIALLQASALRFSD
jgi:hypothetical protein